jgi:hypothetical protein
MKLVHALCPTSPLWELYLCSGRIYNFLDEKGGNYKTYNLDKTGELIIPPSKLCILTFFYFSIFPQTILLLSFIATLHFNDIRKLRGSRHGILKIFTLLKTESY